MDILTDYSKPHPMLKYQYTYKDLQAAYEAGKEGEMYQYDYMEAGAPLPNFENWFKEDFDPEINSHGK